MIVLTTNEQIEVALEFSQKLRLLAVQVHKACINDKIHYHNNTQAMTSLRFVVDKNYQLSPFSDDFWEKLGAFLSDGFSLPKGKLDLKPSTVQDDLKQNSLFWQAFATQCVELANELEQFCRQLQG